MNTVNKSYLDTNQIIKRSAFIPMLKTALDARQDQFARQACLSWLANFPGDLYVSFLYASSLVNLGDLELAITILDKISKVDPEFYEAISLLDSLTSVDSPVKTAIVSILQYLSRKTSTPLYPAPWLSDLEKARQAFENNILEDAEKFTLDALTYDPPTPLPNILHLKIEKQKSNTSLIDTLGNIYSLKWPNTVQIRLLTALNQLDLGQETNAVDNLHWCAVHDTTGQVVTRILGGNHRFTPLWPSDLEIYLDVPVPSQVAASLGWNRLSSGFSTPDESLFAAEQLNNDPVEAIDPITAETGKGTPFKGIGQPNDHEFALDSTVPLTPENRKNEIQEEFDGLAKKVKKSTISNTDTRYPTYVILSSKTALVSKYGENTTQVLGQLFNELSTKIINSGGWDSIVFYPDDSASSIALGTNPITNNDPWKIKLALRQLDESLSKKGEMIGAVLIVGGDEIVPFHKLPNPTDDFDTAVPSDNPYATLDENYYVPQWPVGRIPDEKGPDAGFLIEQFRRLISEYSAKSKSNASSKGGMISWFASFLASIFGSDQVRISTNESIGYSAEVWQMTSEAVFDTISAAKKLITCPPVTSKNLDLHRRPARKFGYYNLHGLQDGPDWYGQKNPLRTNDELDYPVAISPNQLGREITSSEIVFSEACYGAHIIDKQADDSMALKFLSTGTRCMLGSTCIAYGSVVRPLIAADLLANEFWRQILGGISTGYALMRAKINLTQMMIKKQGYLDGEDQKTILSFVLFGDPLASLHGIKGIAKPLVRAKTVPDLRLINDSNEEVSFEETGLPDEILTEVKAVVSKYLPGLQNGEFSFNTQNSIGKFIMSTNDKNKGQPKQGDRQNYVVTLKKSISQDKINHQSFARMTLNRRGKIIKLAMSR